jgi:hypothetical protein
MIIPGIVVKEVNVLVVDKINEKGSGAGDPRKRNSRAGESGQILLTN